MERIDGDIMAKHLSTLDNPYNPYEDFDHWYQYDMAKGWSTCCLMARIAPCYSEILPDSYIDELQEDAFKRIVKLMPEIYWIVDEAMTKEQFEAAVKKNKDLFNKSLLELKD